MTFSMTAFARFDSNTELASYSWEIRSVNSRYLELHFRLPESLKAIEGPLRDRLRKQLSRGKVEVTLKFDPQAKQQALSINEELVAQVSAAADAVHGIIGPGNALDSLEILKWPGVLESPKLDLNQANEEALVSFEEALSQLIAMREREGSALQNIIETRLHGIDTQVASVRNILPEILKAQRERLRQKVSELTEKFDNERLEQEMAILLQKNDVDEELDRLDAHLIEVKNILKSGGPIGRRLDFMMQELNREANTLSSKSISHLTTQISVELKVLIEQMREQVQNIE
mgnify:FL=1